MKYLTKNKHWNIVEDYNLDKLLYLLIDRPYKTNIFNDFLWKNHRKQLHRDYDLPAKIWHKGEMFWCKNHEYHRNDNPAIIHNNRYMEYHINGKYIKSKKRQTYKTSK